MEGSTIPSFPPGFLKLLFSLPALNWDQAVLVAQELVAPIALKGSHSSMSVRDESR